MTYGDYLALEEKSLDVKHEFIAGEIHAMSGGTPAHSALAATLIAILVNHLRGRPCTVFTSDLRIRAVATGMAAYPDVSVVCGNPEMDPEDLHALTNPILLVEVLSDSTEARDRGVKAAHYRHIPSLREYVLVSQTEPHVEVHRLNEAGRWELYEYRRGEVVELASIGCTVAIDALYRDPLAAS
jgi:Uma2 family endonuclease